MSSSGGPDWEGVVWKQGKWFGIWSRRYFVLKDTTLQSYEADKNNKPVKEARDEFNLTTWKFEKNIKAKPNKSRPYLFRMVDSTNNKFFLLATNTEAEMVTWLTKTMNVFYFVKYQACLWQVIKCQAILRGLRARKKYQKTRKAIIKIQANFRMYRERYKYKLFRFKLIKIQAMCRRWRARRDFKAIVRRKRIAAELLQTEQIYVNSLFTVIEVFLNPLLASSHSSTPIMPNHEVLQIFGNIVQLHSINLQLLNILEDKVKHWSRETTIGDAFNEQMMDKLYAAYTPFVLNYTEAMDFVEKMKKKSPQFTQFLQNAYCVPRTNSLDLSSFLIQPIQRLPRYELLIKDLIKHTEKSHADFPLLNIGLQRVMRVTKQINEKKGDKENLVQIVGLQKKLTGQLMNQIEWDTHHKLIREADGTCSADSKVSYIFLLNEFILLAQKQKNTTTSSYLVRGIVPLRNVSVTTDKENDRFTIKLPSFEHVVITIPVAAQAWSAEVQKITEQLRTPNSPRGLSFSTGSLVLHHKSTTQKIAKVMSLSTFAGKV